MNRYRPVPAMPVRSGMAAVFLALSLHPVIVLGDGLTDAQARAFFNDQGCNACHGVDEYRLGPSFRLVAQQYRDADAAVLERLALKIRYGGAGAWGTVPMVSNPQLTPEQTLPVLRWILALDPGTIAAP
jgi:cytochrome c